MKATISVRYFALLRDLAGKAGEQLSIDQGETASRVYLRLAEQYDFPLGLTDIRVAVNDDFATTDHPLSDGDALVFIPPVAGG
jgi:molybdopterin converting factor subunit 1